MEAATAFNDGQIRTLVILERLGGSLSLFCVLLIFISYFLFPRLRTVPNTFIVFASVANAGAAVACIIAYDGILRGQTSPLCQVQGFLFEMFLQSDTWWSLAMAVNVLLVFVKGANPRTIRKWGWLYCLICYGGPFGIALACLLVTDSGKTLIYGNAGTWCWISDDWNSSRIYSSYMLVWLCILASLTIYIGIGAYIFRTRSNLRQVSGSGSHVRGTFEHPALNESVPERVSPSYSCHPSVHSILTQRQRSAISMSDWPLSPGSGGVLFGPSFADFLTEGYLTSHSRQASSASAPFLTSSYVTRPNHAHSPTRSPDPSNGHSRYPSSNSGGLTPFLLASTPGHSPSPTPIKRSFSGRGSLKRFALEDPVKRAYLRTATLFALSVLVTWVPTSIHRVHGVIYGTSPYGYHLATAALLPLQGVWNAIIFFTTSWTVLRESVADASLPRWREVKPQLREQPKKIGMSRNGRSVYSMWRDAEPVGERGIGLGISWKNNKEAKPQRGSWDFLDIGMGENLSQSRHASYGGSASSHMGYRENTSQNTHRDSPSQNGYRENTGKGCPPGMI
ncbi:hypothetical protein B0H67DRAFT_255128 [Lasiosphaeris hirsuta]|uniref:G-protein coupled receptors family 2 profile 2 domain-containing protein n=1 Tax=Lasiosphaeris hirsuta TaxID=260670 RepID=A0AA40DY62_9PEZI|nr:hypothetical protein B0H67DRAFT_255128 [Lasiosphaeris hirsuta]